MTAGRTFWTDGEREKLRDLLSSGRTTRDAASELGRTIIAVRTAATRMNLVAWDQIPTATCESVRHYAASGWSSSRIARRLRVPEPFVVHVLGRSSS